MKIFLFDIDGTITEPRKQISNDMLIYLDKLHKIGKIGFVTGSNFDYIKEQILNYIPTKKYNNLLKNIILLPCNGTKKFIFNNNVWVEEYSSNIKNIISQIKYNKLIKNLLDLQSNFILLVKDAPLTGNFISYRESMINWCPIGRDAKEPERNWFIKFDHQTNYRKDTIEIIKNYFKNIDINFDVKYGGDTSFDIFPKNWDKTYALKHFDLSQDELYFFGDRCFEGGNDFELFQEINKIKKGHGISVKNINETIHNIKIILNEII